MLLTFAEFASFSTFQIIYGFCNILLKSLSMYFADISNKFKRSLNCNDGLIVDWYSSKRSLCDVSISLLFSNNRRRLGLSRPCAYENFSRPSAARERERKIGSRSGCHLLLLLLHTSCCSRSGQKFIVHGTATRSW